MSTCIIRPMDLDAAMEGVYAAFADVAKPPGVDGCPCCMTAEEYEVLTAKALRELTAEELDTYARDALYTMGTEEDYQYFLPRIFELTVEDGPNWLAGVEIGATKLRMAGFESWSDEKRASITDLWLTVIQEMAASTKDEPDLTDFRASDIEGWLAAATLIPIPVSPFTHLLDAYPEIIHNIYDFNLETVHQGRLKNAFLEDEPSEGQTEIANWLCKSVESQKESQA